MPRILSLETSTSVCSAAIHDNGNLIAASEIHEEHSHASKLAVLVENLFKITGYHSSSFDGIAVASGPGSYTGLRIGTSTAKGLCFALDRPLITVDSLSIMSCKLLKSKVALGVLCPMIDARRMEVYFAIYNDQLQSVQPIQSGIIGPTSFGDLLDETPVTFFGTAVAKCSEVIRHPNARFVFDIFPSAIELGEIAALKFENGDTADLTTFEPLYLKEFLVKKSTKIDGVLNK